MGDDNMKRISLGVIAVLIMMSAITCFVVPVSASEVIHSGQWGDLNWELNEATGHLTISGNGEMMGMYFDTDGTDAWLAYKKAIKTVAVEEGVTSIGDGAFMLCKNMKSITLPDSLVHIDDSAFECCTSLTDIVIPSCVSSIGVYVFSTCVNLGSITVEQGNEIYHSAENCIIHTERKTLIAGCKNSVIPNDGSVTSIGGGAFSQCYDLKSIIIPNTVTVIGAAAFSECYELTTVYLSNSITQIGVRAFFNCEKLKKVVYCGAENEWNAVDHMMDWDYGTDNYSVSYHSWNSGEITVKPTHMESGEKIVACTLCGESETKSVSKLSAHEYGEWQEHNDEKHQRICVCGAVQTGLHQFGDEKDVNCNACGYLRTLKEESITDTQVTDEVPVSPETSTTETFSFDFITGCTSIVTDGAGLLLLLAIGAIGGMFKKNKHK